MKQLEGRNQKIIDAVIEKAERDCPGSLAMIGIYGSFLTGDIHEKSDLDLLLLINDENGRQLAVTFIQDDLLVGHDIYCTTWENLKKDARYENPNISKLMDSKIVYCSDKKYINQLELLRNGVKEKLDAPFSREDFNKAGIWLKEAEHFYAEAMIAERLPDIWLQTGSTITCIENAIAMLNKRYFHYGVKRIYEELEAMEKRPEHIRKMIEDVISGNSARQVKERLTELMKETKAVFNQKMADIAPCKEPVTEEALKGSYEEMYSNWRNKMDYAAVNSNRHLSFMSMIRLQQMLLEIGNDVKIDFYNVLQGYDPVDLFKNAKAFEEILTKYSTEYQKADMCVRHHLDLADFREEYLK